MMNRRPNRTIAALPGLKYCKSCLEKIIIQLFRPVNNANGIPNIAITEEHVAAKLSCTICYEDFRLDEMVRQLPCKHIYHEECIIPWVREHGRCPICRQVMTPDPIKLAALQDAIINAARPNIDLSSTTHIPGTPSTPSTSPQPTAAQVATAAAFAQLESLQHSDASDRHTHNRRSTNYVTDRRRSRRLLEKMIKKEFDGSLK